MPPPEAFPRLSGDWGTREHARQAERDKRDAREQDDGNKRRERAGIASDWGRGRIRKERVYARN